MPVFWWWAELGGHRVVVVTDDRISVSGVLDGTQLAALESARRADRLASADLGTRAFAIQLMDLGAVALLPERGAVRLEIVDNVTSFTIAPSDPAVAAGIFDELHRRHGVGEVRAEEIPQEYLDRSFIVPWSDLVVRLGTFGVVGVMIGLSAGAAVMATGVSMLVFATVAAILRIRDGEPIVAWPPAQTELRFLFRYAPQPFVAPLPADAIDFSVLDGEPDPLGDLLAVDDGLARSRDQRESSV